jgi:hypothetical protein
VNSQQTAALRQIKSAADHSNISKVVLKHTWNARHAAVFVALLSQATFLQCSHCDWQLCTKNAFLLQEITCTGRAEFLLASCKQLIFYSMHNNQRCHVTRPVAAW